MKPFRPSRLFLSLFGLCFLLSLTSCVQSPTTPSNHYAGLVIQHADGGVLLRCIRFQEEEITGEQLLKLSEIPYIADFTNPMGIKVCSIDGQGCNFPTEDCFCQCGNTGPCTYWAYFALNQDGDWVYAPVGPQGRKIHNGDVDAWSWLRRASKNDPTIQSSFPETNFEAICGGVLSGQ